MGQVESQSKNGSVWNLDPCLFLTSGPHLDEFECFSQLLLLASLVAQWVKSLRTIQETWVWSLGWEDHLEKEMATHSSILAWESPWTEKPGRLQSMGSQELDITEQLKFWPLSLLYIRNSFWVNLSFFLLFLSIIVKRKTTSSIQVFTCEPSYSFILFSYFCLQVSMNIFLKSKICIFLYSFSWRRKC